MKPGEVIVKASSITINEGLATKKIKAVNKGTRPIQIGSHFHFFEVNKLMSFDRAEAFGYRLDIASGTAVRFEPGEEKEVQLVALAGKKIVYGMNNLTDGYVHDENLENSLNKAKIAGFIS